MTPDQQAAAIDGLATNGPAQAYTMGYEAGRAEALDETTTLELVADGYTAAQEARADALAAASRLFAESLGTDWDDPDDPANAARAVLAVAAEFATWIEHGDQPKACAPIPCPPFEQANLTVDHAFDWSDVNGQITASCSCGGWTAAGRRGEENAAYRLWIDHSANPYLPQPAAAPATVAEHVEDAIGLVGSARAVVADAIGTIKDNPDLRRFGHRVDQALDAAKMAQPRARPTQT